MLQEGVMLGESEFKGRWLFMLARGLEGETVLVVAVVVSSSSSSSSMPHVGIFPSNKGRAPESMSQRRAPAISLARGLLHLKPGLQTLGLEACICRTQTIGQVRIFGF